MIQVDEVLFEYDFDELTWVPIKENATDRHVASLNHFLITETPAAEEYYRNYFKFIDHLEEVLNSVGLCLER